MDGQAARSHQGRNQMKKSKRQQEIEARRAADPIAQAIGRDDIDYESDELPTAPRVNMWESAVVAAKETSRSRNLRKGQRADNESLPRALPPKRIPRLRLRVSHQGYGSREVGRCLP